MQGGVGPGEPPGSRVQGGTSAVRLWALSKMTWVKSAEAPAGITWSLGFSGRGSVQAGQAVMSW